jgi:hypothetical protein
MKGFDPHRFAVCLFALVAGAVAALPTHASPAAPSRAAGRDGTWHIIPAESFVGYRVRERLSFLPLPNDAVGRTSAIIGSARVEHGVIVATTVSADARTLKSDRKRRDDAVRSLLAREPVETFALSSPVRLPTLHSGKAFSLRAPGILRLHGVSRRVVFPLRARWTVNSLEVIGSLRIAFADYRIRRPKFGPVLSVSKHAQIEVHLSLRPR